MQSLVKAGHRPLGTHPLLHFADRIDLLGDLASYVRLHYPSTDPLVFRTRELLPAGPRLGGVSGSGLIGSLRFNLNSAVE